MSQITKETPPALLIISLEIWDYPQCTSSGCILQKCNVSSVLVHSFIRRSCAYKIFGQIDSQPVSQTDKQTNGQMNRVIPIYPHKTLFVRGNKYIKDILWLTTLWQSGLPFYLSVSVLEPPETSLLLILLLSSSQISQLHQPSPLLQIEKQYDLFTYAPNNVHFKDRLSWSS